MESLIGTLTSRLRHLWSKQPVPVALRSFRCQCDRPVFFCNSQCLTCHTELGYEVEQGRLLPLQPDAQVAGIWRKFGDADDSPAYRRCGNYRTASDAIGCALLRVGRGRRRDADRTVWTGRSVAIRGKKTRRSFLVS